MARTRSERIKRIKADLIDRLEAGFCRPGNHFASNRELTTRYGISYQTAHRIIQELEQEGYLHRVPSSGTYVAGCLEPPKGVALVFHPNAQDENYGGILLKLLKNRFEQEGIECTHVSGVVFEDYVPGFYNIIWGQEYDVRRLPSYLNYSLMIDGLPSSGVNATFTDSIFVDYDEAGRAAGRLLRDKYGSRKVAVIAGQADNGIYCSQVNGFREIYPDCEIFHQDDWTYWSALQSAESIRERTYDGYFSVGDSGVLALQRVLGERAPIVAYGDPAQLEAAGVSGVGIPWHDIVEETVRLYRLRSGGDCGVGHQRIIRPDLPSEVASNLSYAS